MLSNEVREMIKREIREGMETTMEDFASDGEVYPLSEALKDTCKPMTEEIWEIGMEVYNSW